jgi:uncharacterized protein YndB with AHSA1/START domain
MSESVEVVISRRFAAAPERVFDAWLDPVLIGQWMFGPRLRDETILRIAVDAKVGGRFSFRVCRDGVDIDHVGTYLAINRPTRLVFTWGIVGESTEESQVVILIAPEADGCSLTLTHTMDAKWAEYADRVRGGWTKMTDVLAEVLQEHVGEMD